MHIYNSIMLDKNGIVRQVKSTFLSALTPISAGRNASIVYASMYSFSRYAAGMFINAFSSHRFEEDDKVPDSEEHTRLQQVILSGSHFANKSRGNLQNDYAELVFCFSGGDIYYEQEILKIFSIFSAYSSGHCEGQNWRIFSSRKHQTGDALLFIAVSLEKIHTGSPMELQLDRLL